MYVRYVCVQYVMYNVYIHNTRIRWGRVSVKGLAGGGGGGGNGFSDYLLYVLRPSNPPP